MTNDKKNSLLNDYGFEPLFINRITYIYYNNLPSRLFEFQLVIKWLRKLYIRVDVESNGFSFNFSMLDLKNLSKHAKEFGDYELIPVYIVNNGEEFTIDDMIDFLSVSYQVNYKNSEIDTINNSNSIIVRSDLNYV